jgi:hypothetical protein
MNQKLPANAKEIAAAAPLATSGVSGQPFWAEVARILGEADKSKKSVISPRRGVHKG